MIARFYKVFTRVVFILAAVALAFLLGQRKANLPEEIESAVKRPGQNEPSHPAAAGAQNPPVMTDVVFSSAPSDEVAQLIKMGPESGLAGLANLPPGTETQRAYQMAFGSWANDPKLAPEVAAMAYALTDGLNRPIALQSVMASWVFRDPNAALDWASSLAATDPEPLKDALSNLSGDRHNPELAAQYVDDIQDASARNDAIQTIARNWALGWWGNGDTDPAAALAWLDQVATGENYDTNATYILNNLAKKDPATAASILDEVTEPEVRATTIASLASSWGQSDPKSALAWAQALPDSDSPGALDSIVTSWSKTDPAAAVAYVQASGDPAAFLSTAPTLVQALAASNPQAALDFSNSLPEGDAKNQALNNVLVSMAKSDFTTAWTYAADLPATDNPADIMGNLVGALVTKDPTQAATLLQQFPEGTAQLNAASSVAATWALQDPDAFSQWANDLPAGALRDTAVSAAITAAQSAKLPAPERAELVQQLAQVQTAAK